MSNSIPTGSSFHLPTADREVVGRPATPVPGTPVRTDMEPAPSRGEHILPEGLMARRPSLGTESADGSDTGRQDTSSNPSSRSSSPPRSRQPLSHLRRHGPTARPAAPGVRHADHEHGEHVPTVPLPANAGGGLVDGGTASVLAIPSPSGQRALAATASESSAGLPRHDQRDEISQLTRQMPGAFDPLPRQETAAEPGARAPGGLASLHAEEVPSHRDLNPRIDIGSLAEKLPDDITGCVAYMLSSMRKSPDDIPALERLATQQAAVLESRGIHTRDDLVSVLKQVQWRDAGAGLLHGMASSSGFNLGTLPANLKLADLTLGGLMKALPNASVAVPALITGALMGFALSVLDVGSGAAASKTFHDAYFTRPPGDLLPEPIASANPHNKLSMALDNSLAAGAAYGARNGGLRIPLTLNFELKGQPKVRALADGLADPLAGLPIGGGGMRLIKNDRDVGAGRAGFQHFLARDDLGACIDHLQKPGTEQVLSVAARVGAHAKNLKQTFPQALGDVFASKLGWTSHAILTAGFGGLTAMVASAPAQLQERGLSEKDANVTTQMLKFVVLQALYHVWGGALGAVGGPRTPDPAARSAA